MKKGEIIINPIVTEKSTELQQYGKYCFKINPRANKKEVMQAVKDIFGVEPVSCNIINVKGKRKRERFKYGYTSAWKKAIVALKEGEKIELFEGV
ncbi:MAG: 50S ribosomal protein L23 [Spirochaetota bacterium]